MPRMLWATCNSRLLTRYECLWRGSATCLNFWARCSADGRFLLNESTDAGESYTIESTVLLFVNLSSGHMLVKFASRYSPDVNVWREPAVSQWLFYAVTTNIFFLRALFMDTQNKIGWCGIFSHKSDTQTWWERKVLCSTWSIYCGLDVDN